MGYASKEARGAFKMIRIAAGIPENIVGSVVRVFYAHGVVDLHVSSCAYNYRADTLTLSVSPATIIVDRKLFKNENAIGFYEYRALTLRYTRKSDWALSFSVKVFTVETMPVDIEFLEK